MNSNKREILFCGGCSKPIDNHDPNCPFYEELDDALPTPAPVAEQEKMYSRKDMEDCFNNSRLQFKMDDTFCYETFNDYIKTLNQKS